MRLTTPRADLARILTNVIKAVEARNTIPILGTVKMVAADGKLTAVATDLDIEIKSSIAAGVESAGSFCVNATMFNGIVAKLPANGEVLLELKDATLTIVSGRSRFKLQTLPDSDFPDIAAGEYDTEFDIDLAALVGPVAFAMSTETNRYYLCGVYLVPTGNTITAVATDGHKLARSRVDQPNQNPLVNFQGVIIPAKTIGLLPKGVVSLSVSPNKIRIVTADTTITSKLIDGAYPDYERVIPKANDKVVTVDKQALTTAADRVSTVGDGKDRAVKINIAAEGLTLSVTNGGDAANEDVAAIFDGEPLYVGLNSKYLAAVAGMFPNGPLTLKIADAGAPVLFVSDAAPELLAVCMPLRVPQ